MLTFLPVDKTIKAKHMAKHVWALVCLPMHVGRQRPTWLVGGKVGGGEFTRAGVEPAHGMPKLTCNQTTKHNGGATDLAGEVEDADKPIIAKCVAAASNASPDSLPVHLEEVG